MTSRRHSHTSHGSHDSFKPSRRRSYSISSLIASVKEGYLALTSTFLGLIFSFVSVEVDKKNVRIIGTVSKIAKGKDT